MNNNIKISIIIPCFNNAKFVEKCLNSIDEQSFLNYEVIIVNDGSQDNSRQIIEKHINGKENFHLINQDNAGVSVARNNGLKIARGEYVCFVDADDFVEKDYLKKLYESNIKNDSDLCICSVIHEDSEGQVLYTDQLPNLVLTNMETANLKKLIWGYACNKLFKLDIIRNKDLSFDKNIKFAEDELFYLNYLFCIKKVCLIDDCLYHYVRQKKSATKDTTNMSVQISRFESRKMIIDLLKNNKVCQYVIDRHIIACIDTCLLVLAYKFKGQKLKKEQKLIYLNYIKTNKETYLNDNTINWKAKFYLKLACFSLPIYKPVRRIQLKVTHRL